jgi:hypothetical protein
MRPAGVSMTGGAWTPGAKNSFSLSHQVHLAVNRDDAAAVQDGSAVIQLAVLAEFGEPAHDGAGIAGRVRPFGEDRVTGAHGEGTHLFRRFEHVARQDQFGQHDDVGAVGSRG